ncbi:hypothetical protein VTN00DRAFT_678 [Thermoascus crustaceus]|uniref:uncharacterized protein n=1 Tax=Thermoascus crustaceus TaxID=5088 RepID=UPI003742B2BA
MSDRIRYLDVPAISQQWHHVHALTLQQPGISLQLPARLPCGTWLEWPATFMLVNAVDTWPVTFECEPRGMSSFLHALVAMEVIATIVPLGPTPRDTPTLRHRSGHRRAVSQLPFER